MATLRFTCPLFDDATDLQNCAAAHGVALTAIASLEIVKTTNSSSPFQYICYADDSFLETYPRLRKYLIP